MADHDATKHTPFEHPNYGIQAGEDLGFDAYLLNEHLFRFRDLRKKLAAEITELQEQRREIGDRVSALTRKRDSCERAIGFMESWGERYGEFIRTESRERREGGLKEKARLFPRGIGSARD